METTKEAFKNMNTFIEPWTKAVKSWITETEKIQQTAVDGWTKAIDNSHKLAKEGLDMAASLGVTLQKQVSEQIERTVDFVNSFKS